MSDGTMEQMKVLVAYMAACEGGNVQLAQEIAKKAEEKGISINFLETEMDGIA